MRTGSLLQDAEAYEAEHVHDVYEQIAPHFSTTRHKVRSQPLKFPRGGVKHTCVIQADTADSRGP